MRFLSGLWVFALLVFCITGCNEVTDPTTAPVEFTVGTYQLQRGYDGPRVEGVQICETDTTNCEMTDARGEATLQLPFDQEISCTLEKEGYMPTLYVNVIPATGEQSTVGFVPDRSATEFFEDLMSQYPMRDNGVIATFVSNPVLEGVAFDLVDATGTEFYMDEDWNPRPDLTEVTSTGWGGFIEVGPGVHHVEIGGTAQGCTIGWGWPDAVGASIRIPVREGYISSASVRCPVPP